MKITILCDQTDCKYNTKQFSMQEGEGICLHKIPSIIMSSKSYERLCGSKVLKICYELSPSCKVCEEPTPDNCINCCHKAK
jgi:hypothetical protein